MFEHFTFGMPARPESQSIREVSPTDTSPSIPLRRTRIQISDLITSPPSPSLSPLDDLIHKMSDQTVESDLSPTSYFTRLSTYPLPSLSPTSSTSSGAFSEFSFDGDSHSPPSSPIAPLGSPSPYADRRLQRQRHTQLQCSGSHIRSINELVAQMVATGSQCTTLSPPVAKPVASLSPDQECFDDDVDEISLRQASAPSGIRKVESKISYRGRAETVAKATGAVRARKPKMRLRKETVPAVRRKE